MNIEMTSFSRRLYGFSGTIQNQKVWESGSVLMDRMWKEVRAKGFAHKGLNHWFYEGSGKIFVGVELEQEPAMPTDLESKVVEMPRCAYWKHVGPYSEMGRSYTEMHAEIRRRGLIESPLSLEIYGHDNGPDSVPEVELLIGLK